MGLEKHFLPADPGARRRRDRWLLWLGLLVLALLAARAVRKDAGVLENNQAFGARFVAGEDPYFDPTSGRRMHGPYPPSYVLICAPLSRLPTRAARLVWVLVQCLALAGLYPLMRRRLRLSWPALEPHASVVYAAALLLVSRYLLRDMAAGGGNLLYSALAVGGLELALAGAQRWAGLPIALGLVLKPNLALLLVFFALSGRWRALVSALAIAAVLFWLPAATYGPARYAELASRWGRDVVAFARVDDLHDSRAVPEGMPPAKEAMNQNLREAVFRLLRDPGDSGAADVHFGHATAAQAAWVGRGLALLLFAAAAWTAFRARGPTAEWHAAMGFIALSLLLSPVTWKAHSVALLPAFFGAVAEAGARRRGGLLTAFLVAYYLACDVLSEEVVGKSAKNLLQAWSIVTWANVAVFAVLLMLARSAGGGGTRTRAATDRR